MKVALFDFCETLVDFQTGDAFVWFAQRRRRRNSHLLMAYRILRGMHILWLLNRLAGVYVGKRLLLLSLKGCTEEEMNEYAKAYYASMIRPRLIRPVVDELRRLKSEGFSVYVVSGGYEIYQRHFAEEFGISGVIANEMEFKDGKFTGRMAGEDCMGEVKVEYIRRDVPDSHYDEWVAFSDSASDIPMLDLVGQPVVVSRDKPQPWAEKYRQLIYHTN